MDRTARPSPSLSPGPVHTRPEATLEELLADRIATEAARIAEERVREVFDVTRFDPDEVLGPMDAKEAAEFLGIPYTSFREIAPSLPRIAITPARFGYLRRELLAHFKDGLGQELGSTDPLGMRFPLR